MAIDQQRLENFLHRYIADVGAAMSATLVLIGDRLGLYRALAEIGPATPAELATKTRCAERYIREWLAAQAAGGYVEYDSATGRFYLNEEQAFALTHQDSPVDIAGGFLIAAAMVKSEPKLRQAFRFGHGVGWHEHASELFEGTERVFRPNYATNLVNSWIPALDGVEDRLQKGARVADVGCGHGSSTILMAQAYPNSEFYGFDYHASSIEVARMRAKAAGVSDRVKFEVAAATDFPGGDYDLVAFFDALHDLGDPEGAARRTLRALDRTGTWMVVEPFAGDKLENNLNPLGRMYYSASTMFCTPGSLAQDVGAALGAQAGEERIRGIAHAAGFSAFRRAAETPLNVVYEIRP